MISFIETILWKNVVITISKPTLCQHFNTRWSFGTNIWRMASFFVQLWTHPGAPSLASHPDSSKYCIVWFFCCCLVDKLCLTLCDSVDCSSPGFPVLHCLPEFAQTDVHWVSDAIQPSHPPSPPSPPALNLSQHQGLFQWVDSSHLVAKVSGLQLQHQSIQWIFRVDFL